MKNPFRSYTVEKLIPMLDAAAVDSMMCPIFNPKATTTRDMTQQEITIYNSLVAAHNEGIRELARVLQDRLDGDEDG